MTNFDNVTRVKIPQLTPEQLEKILSTHDKDEVARALGYERK